MEAGIRREPQPSGVGRPVEAVRQGLHLAEDAGHLGVRQAVHLGPAVPAAVTDRSETGI